MVSAKPVKILPHRHQLFLFLLFTSCLIFWAPLRDVITLALRDERYAHILAVPFVCAALIYYENRNRLATAAPRRGIGVLFASCGCGLLAASRIWGAWVGSLSFAIAGLALVWIGLFNSCYGTRKVSRFVSVAWLLLFLMVPVPGAILDKVVAALQIGSAEVAYRLFRLVGVPVFRHGTVMSLPGLELEVAPQCSGIRSTMALLVTGIVLAEISLRSGWAKLLVILCVGPIGMLRNAIRIATITLMGIYVNKSFLFGNLHRRGGLLFGVIGFAILIPIVWLLRRYELRAESARANLTISCSASNT